jgi:hypothetical protein
MFYRLHNIFVRCIGLAALLLGFVQESLAEPPGDFALNLVRFGSARVEHTDYAGKALAGVVVEIEALQAQKDTVFNASSVSAHFTSGETIPVQVVFIVDSSGVYGAALQRGSVANGWTIFIDNEKFQCFGSTGRMAMLVEKGGIKASFSQGGWMKLGLLFPGNVKDLVSIAILGKNIELKPKSK